MQRASILIVIIVTHIVFLQSAAAQSAGSQQAATGSDSVNQIVTPPVTTELQQLPVDTETAVPDSMGQTGGFGTVMIETEPESAIVVLDDQPKGKSPLMLIDIPVGRHTIILKKKGHFAKKATINIVGGSDSKLTFELVKPVRLVITSEPVGAAIFIENRQIGTTPYVDSILKPDTYTLDISLAGYRKQQHIVSLGSGESDSMHIALTPVELPAVVTVPQDSGVAVKKEEKKEQSRLAAVLDKVALGIFIAFSAMILVIELTQDK